MPSSDAQTSTRLSPDSGEPWTAEGAWLVAPGIHRIPLPLPMDGLRAVNVYVIEGQDGLTLIDGGWAVREARDVLERSLGRIGAGLGDIRRFLVTHAHRDHYTLAALLGTELGVEVTLGHAEHPTFEVLHAGTASRDAWWRALVASGAIVLADEWEQVPSEVVDPAQWRFPDRWLDGDITVDLGARSLDALHTPGHTPGHFVFVERSGASLRG